MKLLRRYLISHVLMAIAVVTLALTGLQIFILFVNQLQDIGKGGYDFFVAMKVVGFQLPYQIYLFFPIASLLGVLLGLGMMAHHRELVVMRSAGVSVTQITLAILQVAFILMLLVTWLGESWIPQFNRLAVDEKVQSIMGGQSLRTQYGVWLRDDNDFIFVGSAQTNQLMTGLLQFHFDEQHHLEHIMKMQRLEWSKDHWEAYGVEQTSFFPDHTAVQHIDHMPWQGKLQPTLMQLSNVTPDEMTFKQLYRYISAHHDYDQNISNETLVFWQRLMQPFSTLVMMLLGIPFIFGPLRASTIGGKMVLGACFGFTFYTFNHFLGSMSQVFQLSPIMAATLPTLLFALIGGAMLVRVR